MKRNYFNEELSSFIGAEGKDYSLSESKPFIITYLDSKRSYLVDEDGNIETYVDISKYVSIGDYVNYNPTVSDLNGTQVEEEKLTYTSPFGGYPSSGIQGHGNGYKSGEDDEGQTFTVKPEVKWRILEIENGIVTLISDEPIKKDEVNQDKGNFVLNGPRGYLYAEQELHEICKIYGYGYGADTSKITTYKYGGPKDLDENSNELIGKITGSGARSITIEDINKFAGISADENGILRFKGGNIVDNNYGSTENPTSNVFNITIENGGKTGYNNTVKNLKYTSYEYDKSKIENESIRNLLFNGNYFLASRSISTDASIARFEIQLIIEEEVRTKYLIYCGSASTVDTNEKCNIRPIVTLKSNVIDVNTDYKKEGHWNLR